MNKIIKWGLISLVFLICIGIIFYSVGNYAFENDTDRKCEAYCIAEGLEYNRTYGVGYCDCFNKENNNQHIKLTY
jgi:hypothetical protein